MYIPPRTNFILNRLRDAGFSAYAVGGCVRDSLLGLTPGDWDVCTSALPEETERVFSDLRVIETGLKHGTVTVLYEGEPFEITTFRRDGDYLDHRRPEGVTFVTSLEEDLRRRDFTVNAMAAGPDGAIIDPFGGRQDLEMGVLRCVGDPEARFREDALRILRAMRFSARFGFDVDLDTADAMERWAHLLSAVSHERVMKELTGMLTGRDCPHVLERFGEVLSAVLPEIVPAMGFDQRNPYHNKDVWGHTIEAVSKSAPDPLVRWALLLHDLGKPRCFTLDDRGIGHFYGHPEESARIAEEILTRLKSDNATKEAVCTLVRWHEGIVPAEKKNVRRWIGRLGREQLARLLEVKRADCLAHVDMPGSRQRYRDIVAFKEATARVLEAEECFTLRDLAIGGREVLAAGVEKGPAVGRYLERLLDLVLEDRCRNDRESLELALREMLREKGETP